MFFLLLLLIINVLWIENLNGLKACFKRFCLIAVSIALQEVK